MDWAKMLQCSVDLDRTIRYKHDISQKLEQRIKETYLYLDVELSEIANSSEWFKVWKNHRGKHDGDLSVEQTVLNEFVDALDFFLLMAYLNQWNHLLVIDDEQIEKYVSDRNQKLDLTDMYLAIKKMLYSAYSTNRSTDFSHAWHMFLKFGISGLGFEPADIEKSFFSKNQVNFKRQDENY